MGPTQRKWLFDRLDRSRARWNVVPQQVMMARADVAAGPDVRYAMDQWAAYEVERTRFLEFLGRRKPANPVVLTGDIHSNWVNDLRVDFSDEKSPTVATEFVGTSITSGGDGADAPPRKETLLAENPFVKFYNSQRGYVSCEITAKSMRASYNVVEYVTKPDAPKQTRATFVVEDGQPGAKIV
jgi:alkaline phosphatase D